MVTEHLWLRRFRLDDYENMRALESDADVMRFTSYRVPQSPEQTRERLEKLVASEGELAPLGVWAVELRDSGEFVGWFMVRRTQFAEPELGFMIVRKHWRAGYATEAARALSRHVLTELGHGLVARVDAANTPSIHVLEKLGFRQNPELATTLPAPASGKSTLFFELTGALKQRFT